VSKVAIGNKLMWDIQTTGYYVFCQAFEDLSLQQLSTAACSALVVTLFIIYAVYKINVRIIIIIIISYSPYIYDHTLL